MEDDVPIDKNTTQVGFIGLGIMGRPMAGHIMDAGFSLHIYNRTKKSAAPLLERGAQWHDNPAEVARHADIIISIVGYPKDVEETYFGPDGLLDGLKPGTTLIDMTTSEPQLAVRIAKAASEKGAHALDAPVSGGDVGARDAKLSIMVGGETANFDDVLPLLQLLGTNIVLQGPAGAGQHTKMCNQIVIAGTILGVAEGLSYAKRAGLDPKTVLECIGGGAAGGFQLNVLGARMIEDDFAPGFIVRHMIKDLTIASDEAEAMHADLRALKLAKQQFERLRESGGGDDGTQGVYKVYAP
jgi:3-hydroxyisobutyrate dehydrogenase